MAKQRDEVSTTRAAELLGANEQTIQRHAKRAFEGDRSRFPRESVRRDWSRRWWISRAEIERQLAETSDVNY